MIKIEHDLYVILIETLNTVKETNEVLKTMYNKLLEAEEKAKGVVKK